MSFQYIPGGIRVDLRPAQFREMPTLGETRSLGGLPGSIHAHIYEQFYSRQISRQLLIDIKAYIEDRVPGSTCSISVIPGTDLIPPYIDAKIQFDDPKHETMYILKWNGDSNYFF